MAKLQSLGEPRAMRHTREIWFQIVQQCEKSNLSQEAFAAQRNIPVGTLRSWIYRRRRERDEETPILPVRVIASTAPLARQQDHEGGAIEVALGSDIRLRFSSNTPPAVIAELVALLRAQC